MRYALRFNNGFFKLFDGREYRDIARFGLRKDAQEAVDRSNALGGHEWLFDRG